MQKNKLKNAFTLKLSGYQWGGMIFLMAVGVYAILNLFWQKHNHKIEALAVTVLKPKAVIEKKERILPGTLQAWHQAAIYARTSGYLKKWYVDMGDAVKKGQLLATIESPELDAAYNAAIAEVGVLDAKYTLAQKTAQRWTHLLTTKSVSKQETDEKVQDANAIFQSLEAAKAQRDRLQQLVDFEKVIAPFEGIISARNVDVGMLVNAGDNTNQERALFNLVQQNPLRLYVKIPQSYEVHLKRGLSVDIYFDGNPQKLYQAILIDTAHAIDPTTRTLLAQFKVNNEDGSLLPGSFTRVHFYLHKKESVYQLPINTLLFRREGLMVATVDAQNEVELRNVKINQDFGDTVEIIKGINKDDSVILNPPDSIENHMKVKIIRQGEVHG